MTFLRNINENLDPFPLWSIDRSSRCKQRKNWNKMRLDIYIIKHSWVRYGLLLVVFGSKEEIIDFQKKFSKCQLYGHSFILLFKLLSFELICEILAQTSLNVQYHFIRVLCLLKTPQVSHAKFSLIFYISFCFFSPIFHSLWTTLFCPTGGQFLL